MAYGAGAVLVQRSLRFAAASLQQSQRRCTAFHRDSLLVNELATALQTRRHRTVRPLTPSWAFFQKCRMLLDRIRQKELDARGTCPAAVTGDDTAHAGHKRKTRICMHRCTATAKQTIVNSAVGMACIRAGPGPADLARRGQGWPAPGPHLVDCREEGEEDGRQQERLSLTQRDACLQTCNQKKVRVTVKVRARPGNWSGDNSHQFILE